MNKKTNEKNGCGSLPEAIAWGRPLAPAERDHVEGCAACKRLLTEFARLDQAVSESARDVVVPEGFADRVMVRVRESAAPSRTGSLTRDVRREWTPKLRSFFMLPAVRIAAIGLALAIPLSAAGAA